MPFQETVEEPYWCPGPWYKPWQWGKTCTRRVTRWCYDFAWIETVNYGAIARYRGCEANVNYQIGWKWFFFLGSRLRGVSRQSSAHHSVLELDSVTPKNSP